MNMTPTQEKTAQTEQKKCSIKITSILQQLKSDGLDVINDAFIQGWCLPLPPYVTDAAQELVLRLNLLYTLLEDWKLSLALTYNPLMTAMGYTYEGNDFGWRTDGGCRSQTWSTLPFSDLQLSSDANHARRTSDLYQLLFDHTSSLHVTTTEFRQAMSLSFGPHPHWVLPCNVAQPPHANPPPLLNYFTSSGIPCTHCNMGFHEEHRCYTKDPRNMYRFPPNGGWPNCSRSATLAVLQ